jgi:dolichyl-phosphate beta-glucosyltransferase
MDNPFLSIVIPARNEESRLPRTLEEVVGFLDRQTFNAEVIIVVNASIDKTLDIAQKFSLQHPLIKVIDESLPGKGRAVRRGMLAAKGSYRFFADADLSMPIGEIVRFLPPSIDASVVIASREVPGAEYHGEPLYRHMIGRIFNKIIRLLVFSGLQDTQCGFKMFKADAAEDLFPRQTMNGWSFDVELLCIAAIRGYSVKEVPVSLQYNSEKKISILRESWSMFFDLFKIRRNKRQGRYA